MARSERCDRGYWYGVVRFAALVGLIAVGMVGRPVAQGTRDLAGTWQGTLQADKGQRIVVKIAPEGSGWKGVVYNLDSGMAWEGRATSQMSLQGTELRFAIAPIEASYEGRLSEDGASIAGTWTGGGQLLTLNLVRATGDAAWEIPKAAAAMAKDADPDWEAATVRPSDPNDQHQGFHLDGRQIFVERKTVEAMLELAYNMHKKQIAGAPDWAETELWDVKGGSGLTGAAEYEAVPGHGAEGAGGAVWTADAHGEAGAFCLCD